MAILEARNLSTHAHPGAQYPLYRLNIYYALSRPLAEQPVCRDFLSI